MPDQSPIISPLDFYANLGNDTSKIAWNFIMSDGEDFRKQVCDLLISAGMKIKCEEFISGKHIDILASTVLFGRPVNFAIECKSSESKSLSFDKVTTAALQYESIANDKSCNIHESWIVGNKTFTPQTRVFCEKLQRTKLLTFDELMSIIFDINSYIVSLRTLYEDNMRNKIYIPLRTDRKIPLREAVIDWLERPGQQGMAIVAGYGRGKTTFAEILAGELAIKSIDNGNARMPVLLRLSDISHEVKLSGVILSTIAGAFTAQRLSFDFFLKLNSLGRFIIIADGFDEMKHGLNFAEFEYLFGQIRSLMTGKAKVLLLGRPSAFQSESEELATLTAPDTPSYRHLAVGAAVTMDTVSIDYFTAEEAETFIVSNTTRLLKEAGKSPREAKVKSTVQSWLANIDEELVQRPVHAWMLSIIVSRAASSSASLGLYELYKRFEMASAERELEKPGRDRRLDINCRHQFLLDLAWWSWTEYRSTSFPSTEIPEGIVRNAISGVNIPYETARRELIVSAPLDRKAVGEMKLTFPHRSIQEYLVSEHVTSVGMTRDQIRLYSKFLTNEVIQFIISCNNRKKIQEMFDLFVGGNYSNFHINFVTLMSSCISAGLIDPAKTSKFDNKFFTIISMYNDKCLDFSQKIDTYYERSLSYIKSDKINQSQIAVMFCAMSLLSDAIFIETSHFYKLIAAIKYQFDPGRFNVYARYSRNGRGKLRTDHATLTALLCCMSPNPKKRGHIIFDIESFSNEIKKATGFAIQGFKKSSGLKISVSQNKLFQVIGWKNLDSSTIFSFEYLVQNNLTADPSPLKKAP